MPDIPHCDELFRKYFAPWYSEADMSARGFDATRPDMLQCADDIGKPAFELSPLRKLAQERFICHLTETMTNAAIGDFAKLLGLSPPVDFDWIQRIDDYFDVGRIAELVTQSDPSEDGNSYFITCIELGTLIAATMRSLVPELQWLADSPYWESSLWHPASGHVIPPTHWAIKKLSAYGWDDGLVPKIHCGMEVLRRTSEPE